MKFLISILIGGIFCSPIYSFCQEDTSAVDKKRLTYLLTGEGVLYGATMYGLNSIWYKDYPHSSFHFFNDSREWLQMDKAGHMYSAYYLGKICSYGFRWTGMERKRSSLWGSGLGMLFISSVEVFDGFSEKWGASVSDLVSNTAGFGLYTGQELLWQDQKIILKYSFIKSGYAKYRPDALGENITEMLIKDYNGMTFWLSGNLRALSRNDLFPAWLDISFGYGADAMVHGTVNPPEIDGELIDFSRYRQYYLSLDIDLARIKTNSKILKTVFACLNVIKVPLPTLELSENKVKLHPVYF